MVDYLSSQKILSLRSVFGINAAAKNNISFIDETTLMFVAGRTLIFADYNGEQHCVTGSEQCQDVTAVALRSNSSKTGTTIAVSEKTLDGPCISLYGRDERGNVRKRKQTLTVPDMKSEELVCLAISTDAKYIAAVGGFPDYRLCVWMTDSAKNAAAAFKLMTNIILATASRDAIYQVLFSSDAKHISVSGSGGIFKIFNNEEGSLKQALGGLGKREGESYNCHGWVDVDRCVIASSSGVLYLVERNELKCILPCSPSDDLSIQCIIPSQHNGKGFITGGENGLVSIFESVDDKDYYRRHRTLKISESSVSSENDLEELEKDKVMNFSVNSSGDVLAISTSSGQLYTLNLPSSDILKEEEIRFDHVVTPFHTHGINGLSTCISKPLIATCGKDRTVRIWNYLNNSVQNVKQFPTEPLCLSMHPSGLYVVVGFTDELRFMNLLGNNIREHKSFPVKNCTEVRFSHGGQYFAAVHGNIINVYSTYSLFPVHSLRGHSGKIISIYWTDDDTRLVSTGVSNGTIIVYDIHSEKRVMEHTNRNCTFSSVVAKGKTIITAGNDGMLREYLESGELRAEVTAGEYSAGCLSMTTNSKMIASGLDDGSVRVYTSLEEPEDVHVVHQGKVNSITFAHDDRLLVTAGEDGMLAIYEVRERETGRLKREIKFSEEILISHGDQEETTNHLNELKTRLSEVKSDNEYEQRKKEMEFNEKIKEQAQDFKHEIKKKIESNLQLRAQKQQSQQEYETKITQLVNDHTDDIERLEVQYDQRISATMDQLNAIRSQKEKEIQRLLEEMQQREDEHQDRIAELTDSSTDRALKDQREKDMLQERATEMELVYEEKIRQIEEDRTREIDEMRMNYEQKLKELTQSNSSITISLKLKDEDMKKKDERIEQRDKEIERLQNALREKDAQLLAKEKEIFSMKKENKEREATIVEKEKRIFELKRQNQELEKFKFVLDYKIKSLTEQIKPKEMEIEDLTKKVKATERDLSQSETTNTSLQLQASSLKQQISALKKENAQLLQSIRDRDVFVARFQGELHEVVQHIQDPKTLKTQVKQLYQTYARAKGQEDSVDFGIQKEHDRQRAYLEKTVDSLKKKLSKEKESAKSDSGRVMKENVLLIKEINDLRKETRLLKGRLRDRNVSGVTVTNGRHPADGSMTGTNHHGRDLSLEEALREIDLQKLEIQTLRAKIDDLLGASSDRASSRGMSRPISRERLPPMG